MKKTICYLIALCVLPAFYSFGQNSKAFVSLQRDTLRIGEQTTLSFNLSVEKGTKVEFPMVNDTLTRQIEVINISNINSTVNHNQIEYKKQLTITSFDTGTFSIPALPFIIYKKLKADTLHSQPIQITVQDVLVDTAQPEKAIKTVREIPAPPMDYSWLWWLLLLIPIAAFLYYWFKIRKPKPKKVTVESVPEIPAYEKAMGDLENLEQEKLWQKGLHKQYHSKLSDIVRVYLENRYKIPAPEQTTAEILTTFRASKLLNTENSEALTQLLQLADMVKFARYNPIGSENELSFKNAKGFVQNTKQVTQTQSDKHEGNSI